MTENKKILRGKPGLAVHYGDELPVNEVPRELTMPAFGKFPLLEKALRSQGVDIPRDWSVETILTASAAGAATLLRIDSGLPPQTPEEVRLILNKDNYRVNEFSGQMGYGMMDFEVGYEDGSVWFGKVRMPLFYKDQADLAGLPMSVYRNNGSKEHAVGVYEVFGDELLVEPGAARFTPLGRRLASFIAGSIYSHNQARSLHR